MKRPYVLFVAGRAKSIHGGDIAAGEFVRTFRRVAHVIPVDPPAGHNLIVRSILHALAIYRWRRALHRRGRQTVVCLNHPKFITTTLLSRPMLIYHGIIALRHLEQTRSGVVRWAVQLVQRLAAATIWGLHGAIFAIGGTVSEFPARLRRSEKVHQVNNPMLDLAGAELAPAGIEDLLDQARGKLLFVGRLSAVKRPVELCRLFVDAGLDSHLAILGAGPLEASARLAASGSGIRFLGAQPAETVRHLFRVSAGFVTLSRSDTFCRPIFEAAATGRPTLAPRWPGAEPWLTERSFVGFLDEADADQMCRSIRQAVAADPAPDPEVARECLAFCAKGQERIIRVLTGLLGLAEPASSREPQSCRHIEASKD